jgi:hypothetical protein
LLAGGKGLSRIPDGHNATPATEQADTSTPAGKMVFTVQPAAITIDYPVDSSIFPPEITPPTFLWHDPRPAVRWVVEVSFRGHSEKIHVHAPGEHLQMGELDPQTGTQELMNLSAEQAATGTWKPDADTWAKIKRESVKSPATIVITGFAADGSKVSASAGRTTITTSCDPVGAPIFCRDVPLMTVPHTEKGSIQPLPTSALPLIKWRLRNIAEPQRQVVMTSIPARTAIRFT